jgi:phenylacetic acid degradation operon negative regulatory protein
MTATPSGPLPRSQQGAEPQLLLTSLLGDFWYWRDEHIPSAALVQLLGEFDISPASARAAIRRLAPAGCSPCRAADGRRPTASRRARPR